MARPTFTATAAGTYAFKLVVNDTIEFKAADEELVNKVFEPIVQRITPKLLRATVAAGEDE